MAVHEDVGTESRKAVDLVREVGVGLPVELFPIGRSIDSVVSGKAVLIRSRRPSMRSIGDTPTERCRSDAPLRHMVWNRASIAGPGSP